MVPRTCFALAKPNSLVCFYATLLGVLLLGLLNASTAHARAAGELLSAEVGTQAGRLAIERHPLELQALTDPEQVITQVSAELARARALGDERMLALLYLARANACRVLADWAGQREASVWAQEAARKANSAQLLIRGQISEARALMALQDLSRAAPLLAEADANDALAGSPELGAEVNLAYSSFSDTLGKYALAIRYADRGLALLQSTQAMPTQARLLRNRARAQGKLGQAAAANASLLGAEAIIRRIDDPKLDAEIHLELARIARLRKDNAAQVMQGNAILTLGARLKNSQLTGLGNEVLGLAALQAGDIATARSKLRSAYSSFQALSLTRDELRTLRALIQAELPGGVVPTINPAAIARVDVSKNPVRQNLLGATQSQSGENNLPLSTLVGRFLSLQAELELRDRSIAADDFDARLKFAEQQLDVVRLQGEATLARHRESALKAQQRLTEGVLVLIGALLSLAFGFFVMQRRASRRLAVALAQAEKSEALYRTLADNSRDIVVRLNAQGERIYVSQACRDMLGWEPSELIGERWDLVHPEDHEPVRAAIAELMLWGGSATITYRVRSKSGSYVWIEALARRADTLNADVTPEVIYSGRDVTTRIEAEEALHASEHMLRSITDAIPALITYIDATQRYRFVNAHLGRVFGGDPMMMLGRTVREVRGDTLYDELAPHIDRALNGGEAKFSGQATLNGMDYYYQSVYSPDIAPDNSVRGFFALTFDITEQKLAQRELEKLARVDSLTGLANRRSFDERIAVAIARNRRSFSKYAAPGRATASALPHTGICLFFFDIDQFKSINDSLGHAAGDAVIREFARRVSGCIREQDLMARIGGDEFMLLIEDVPCAPELAAEHVESIKVIANKLLDVVRAPFVLPELGAQISLSVTTSIGGVFAQFSETDRFAGANGAQAAAQWLIQAADKAMYAAKAAGRDQFELSMLHVDSSFELKKLPSI
jgi:diguanylate cyclase (GGDEF)-like protein/PAS domain S-box-containing protein